MEHHWPSSRLRAIFAKASPSILRAEQSDGMENFDLFHFDAFRQICCHPLSDVAHLAASALQLLRDFACLLRSAAGLVDGALQRIRTPCTPTSEAYLRSDLPKPGCCSPMLRQHFLFCVRTRGSQGCVTSGLGILAEGPTCCLYVARTRSRS